MVQKHLLSSQRQLLTTHPICLCVKNRLCARSAEKYIGYTTTPPVEDLRACILWTISKKARLVQTIIDIELTFVRVQHEIKFGSSIG